MDVNLRMHNPGVALSCCFSRDPVLPPSPRTDLLEVSGDGPGGIGKIKERYSAIDWPAGTQLSSSLEAGTSRNDRSDNSKRTPESPSENSGAGPPGRGGSGPNRDFQPTTCVFVPRLLPSSVSGPSTPGCPAQSPLRFLITVFGSAGDPFNSLLTR